MPKTIWLADKVINHFLRGSSQSTISPYATILTADPTTAGLLTSEITGTGFARQALSFDLPADGATQTGTKVSFTIPAAYTTGVTVSHVAVMDSSTVGAGNMLGYDELSSPEVLAPGDVFSIDIADLDWAEV